VPVPTRRLAVVALVVAVARLLLPDDLPFGLLGLDGALLAVAALDWLLAPSPGRVGVERTAPAVVALDTEGEVRWRVTNPTARRLRVGVADELAPSLRARRRRFRVVLPARATATARTTIRPSRRGRFTPTELVVRVDGPLGLAGRQRRRSVPGLLRVVPPFRSRDEAELRIDRGRILEIGLRSARGRGSGTEFDALREYGPDDDFRRIDWAATARRGHAIVRTYRAERNQTVVVLLDNGRSMAGRVAGVPRVEHAMDAAMCVTLVATRLGDRCGMVAFDRHVRATVPPGASRHQVARVTDAIYDLEPELAESDYRNAFATTAARFRRRSMFVILTDLVEQSVGESLLPALPLLARRHVVVVGAVRDPDVERWAADPAADGAETYRKVAAVQSLAARDRAVAELRRRGAIVVDAAPGRLAPQLADAYLSAKATGRL
jgi:uncharacterized protein (DUF58 family)